MTKTRLAYFLPLLLALLLAAALFITLRHGNGGGKFIQHVGDPAPATSLPVLGAPLAQFDINDWKGRAYVVNFFASWCVDCRAEHDGLLVLKQFGVPVIGIAYQDKEAPLREFLARHGDPYLAVALDAKGTSFVDWGLTGVPESFIIDRAGVIRFHYAGAMSENVIETQFLPAWKKVIE